MIGRRCGAGASGLAIFRRTFGLNPKGWPRVAVGAASLGEPTHGMLRQKFNREVVAQSGRDEMGQPLRG